jgi:hypothetical protein
MIGFFGWIPVAARPFAAPRGLKPYKKERIDRSALKALRHPKASFAKTVKLSLKRKSLIAGLKALRHPKGCKTRALGPGE